MQIVPVTSDRQKRRFIDFPHDLYAEDPHYVPELYLGQKELLDERKNPFFRHSQAKLFLAEQDGRVVGRIAAIRNNEYNRFADARVGFFGCFDTVPEESVAFRLLDTAAQWLREQGLTAMLGPTNLTTNDVAGMLVEGFDRPPMVMMAYNKPYYPEFMDRYGFRKQMDLLAYHGHRDHIDTKVLGLTGGLVERLGRRGITIRRLDMRNFQRELVAVREVYKSAWDRNWGFVPPTDAEFDRLAAEMKMIIDPDFALMAEDNGRLVAFALAVPNINEITRTIRRGRLLPTGIFKLLFRRKQVKSARVILLGVIPDYRRLGIEGVFYARLMSEFFRKGYIEGEASWILESNDLMRRGIERAGLTVYKRYRLYEKTL